MLPIVKENGEGGKQNTFGFYRYMQIYIWCIFAYILKKQRMNEKTFKKMRMGE